jgi:hypothetical protein
MVPSIGSNGYVQYTIFDMQETWLTFVKINRDTGRRSDSAHAYIHSTRANHENLHLVCNTKCEK